MQTRNGRIRRKRTRLAAVAGAIALLMMIPQTAYASVSAIPDVTAGTNGTVFDVVQVGTRTIIVGQFTEVKGVSRRNAAAITADGKVDPTFNPNVTGMVYAVAASTDGTTVYLGGIFTAVGTTARAHLAAVDAVTGAVISTWSANIGGTDPFVRSLAVHGNALYVAGRYGSIDGRGRRRLSAVTADTGNVITGFLPAPNNTVYEVRVSPDGTKVYGGGSFTTIGGQTRSVGYAEVLASTGAATAFNPTSNGGRVVTLAVHPSGSTLYVATANNSIFAYNLAGVNSLLWAHKNGGDTQAIAVSDDEIYIGGHFTNIVTYHVHRSYLASLNLDGSLTSWDPNLAGGTMGVWAIAFSPTHVLVGGVFTTVGGLSRKRFARFAGTP